MSDFESRSGVKAMREFKWERKAMTLIDKRGRKLNLEHARYWYVDEHDAFVRAAKKHGKDYKKIEAEVGTKTRD